MSSAAESKNPQSIAAQVQATRRAARELARLSADQRNQILLAAADGLEACEAEILKANREDCESLERKGRELAAGTASAALLKRLKTSSAGIKEMAKQVRDVAKLEDALGCVLATKTANGLVLKGGAEAQQTNRVLVSIWHEALSAFSPSLRPVICALTDRADVARILEMDRDIDLVVPRGSTEFVNYVFQHSRIPFLGHSTPISPIYVASPAHPKIPTQT